MPVCPWCKAEGFDPSTKCHRCGRLATERISLGAAAPARGAPAVPDLDFGVRGRKAIDFGDDDAQPANPLDLKQTDRQRPAPLPAASAPPAPRAAPPAPDMGHGRGAVFDPDDDVFGGGSVSLELDVKPGGPPRSGAGYAAPSPAKVAQPQGPPSLRAPAPAPSFRPIAAGVAERYGAEAPIETFEARVLGEFGDPPKHWWQTPLYAWRVRQRLQELRQELAARAKASERAAAALEAALVALGQRARGTAEKNPAYGRTLDVLRLHEQTLRQRDSALMAETDSHNRKLAVTDQKIAELQTQLGIVHAEERRLSDELTMVEATIQRSEAKLKRLDIELRSAFGPNDPRRGAP